MTMNLIHTRVRERRGFTMIELLVVIAIIGVLVSLLSAAVIRSLQKGYDVSNRSDINQLGLCLETFKSKYGFYPPSQFLLCESPTAYTGGAPGTLMADSTYYIRTMFPRWTATSVDWDWSNAGAVPSPTSWTLDGDQCLTFFLGGIFQNGGFAGFGTNPANPGDFSGGAISPFYEFKPDRVAQLHTAAAGVPVANQNPFYSFLDYYGMPFAYYSSGRTRNNYNRYGTNDCARLQNISQYITLKKNMYMPTGKATLPSPYASSAGNFHLPEGFQIISAGKNMAFGPGSLGTSYYWNSQTAASINADGQDDQTNFNSTLLGGK